MGPVTADMNISLDGYVAGVNQTKTKPFGDGPSQDIIRWMFGKGAEDNAAELAAIGGAGAYIMGRNMFGPDRGAFDLDWTGWWGPEPPYGVPVFVLSHPRRDPIQVGATSFTFCNAGITDALDQARTVAGAEGRVDIAGGAGVVNQYLAADLIDELRIHVTPVIMGAGERLFDQVPARRLEQVSGRIADGVTHLVYRRP